MSETDTETTNRSWLEITNFSRLETTYLNIPLFFAGIAGVIAIVAAGTAVEFLRGLYAPTVIRAGFVGLASGHYLGKAFKKEEKGVNSLLIGGFFTLFVVLLLSDASYVLPTGIAGATISAVSLTLIASSVFMLLVHLGEGIGDAESITEYLNTVSKLSNYSPAGLVVLWTVEELLPVVSGAQINALDTMLTISLLVNIVFILFWPTGNSRSKIRR